ncbi:MAG: ATP-binding protein [Tannerellaceae bacterium]|jgi:predicted ATP-dependent endonuclease of OLD family|nr:ATP-binding protein [Tannerellaceae bacterium]
MVPIKLADNGNMGSVTELLKIRNFFSIKEFDWDIKGFNVITGGMGSGKSLSLKLLYFFERSSDVSILSSSFGKDSLTTDKIYKHINNKFVSIFHSFHPEKDFMETMVDYKYICGDHVFDLSMKWNKDTNKLDWNSEYINDNIEKWQTFFKMPNAPDMMEFGQAKIYNSISDDFKDTFPIAAMFIPAARAITAITNNEFSVDPLLNRFIRLFKSYAIRRMKNDVKHDLVDTMLKIETITIPDNKIIEDGDIRITTHNGREISPVELSSGQQELLYFLRLIKYLPDTSFHYGKSISVHIEEPSAHLFPQEQKDTIEYIAGMYGSIKRKDAKICRFFITTHSPYILNVINNMLKKGDIITRYKDYEDEVNKKISIPPLYVDDVSASFINADGTVEDMKDENEYYLNADKIAEISYNINEDTITLSELNNEFIDRRGSSDV